MNQLTILLVEDNPSDVFFFKEALEASRVLVSLHIVEDGGQAMDFLARRPPHANAPRPDVLVLDLNLPFKNGHEVIHEMAIDVDLRSIPIAVFTSSISEHHACAVYPGPSLYFTKTDDFTRLQQIIHQIARHAQAR